MDMKPNRPAVCVFLLCLCIYFTSQAPGATQPLRVVTFNAALTTLFNTIEHTVRDRADKLMEILNTSLDADVICLTEVWYEVLKREFVEGLKSKYPYSFSASHVDTTHMEPETNYGTPPCHDRHFPRAWQCTEWCSLVYNTSAGMVDCSIRRCGLFRDLSQRCITCLASHHSGWECGLENRTQPNGGGLLMLSKKDIRNAQMNYFYPPPIKVLTPTAYISGQIDGLGTAVCAHLTPNISDVYLEADLKMKRNFSSYADQNKYETDVLIDLTRASQKAVIMGTLYSGPSIPAKNITGELLASHHALMAAGFSFPYCRDVGSCTHCVNDSFARLHNNTIIDHIAIKGLTGSAMTRVLDAPFQNGNYSINLSDHFGVMGTIG